MTRRRENSEDATINLTPMIDVVFLLVIFFMVGAKFSEAESKIAVNLPTVGTSGAISRVPDERVVAIATDGTVSLDDVAMPIEQVTSVLREAATQYPALKVAVRGDADMSHQSFMETLHAVRVAGVTNVAIATKNARR